MRVLAAHKIEIARCSCGCGQVKILLVDRRDETFAAASFDPDQIDALCRDLREVEAGDTMGPAEGVA